MGSIPVDDYPCCSFCQAEEILAETPGRVTAFWDRTPLEREVRLYEGKTTYLLKPFERLHWTTTEAQLDAGTVISETLTG